MRTTVTLDPDAEALLKDAMRSDGVSFKAALNQAIRMALAPKRAAQFRQRTFALGSRPGVPYEKALTVAAAHEDDEILRKLALGK